jgi:hypothetical protein
MLLAMAGSVRAWRAEGASANPGFSYDRQLLVGIDPTLVQYDETRGRACDATC